MTHLTSFLLIFFLGITSLFAQNLCPDYFLIGDAVRLRSDSSLNSETLHLLSIGTNVYVHQRSKQQYWAGGKEDYWYEVEIGSRVDSAFLGLDTIYRRGWVFGAYLQEGMFDIIPWLQSKSDYEQVPAQYVQLCKYKWRINNSFGEGEGSNQGSFYSNFIHWAFYESSNAWGIRSIKVISHDRLLIKAYQTNVLGLGGMESAFPYNPEYYPYSHTKEEVDIHVRIFPNWDSIKVSIDDHWFGNKTCHNTGRLWVEARKDSIPEFDLWTRDLSGTGEHHAKGTFFNILATDNTFDPSTGDSVKTSLTLKSFKVHPNNGRYYFRLIHDDLKLSSLSDILHAFSEKSHIPVQHQHLLGKEYTRPGIQGADRLILQECWIELQYADGRVSYIGYDSEQGNFLSNNDISATVDPNRPGKVYFYYKADIKGLRWEEKYDEIHEYRSMDWWPTKWATAP